MRQKNGVTKPLIIMKAQGIIRSGMGRGGGGGVAEWNPKLILNLKQKIFKTNKDLSNVEAKQFI